MKTTAFATFAFLLCGAASAQKASADAAACDRVAATLKLSNANVTSAHAVAAGQFVPPPTAGTAPPKAIADLPAFCRVALTLTPSSDSDIKSEVGCRCRAGTESSSRSATAHSPDRFSTARWPRRCGADTRPRRPTPDTPKRARRGATGHPEKVKDFGYRAVHETAVDSKTTITNFYGMAPRLSYFTGCSGGGRMAFQVDDSVRLFYAPGMGHCGGGEGPNVFDALTALEQWREQGKAPTEIIATHSTNGTVDRTRPLCPYPQVAQYRGSGSIDQAQNFVCRQGVHNVPNASK